MHPGPFPCDPETGGRYISLHSGGLFGLAPPVDLEEYMQHDRWATMEVRRLLPKDEGMYIYIWTAKSASMFPQVSWPATSSVLDAKSSLAKAKPALERKQSELNSRRLHMQALCNRHGGVRPNWESKALLRTKITSGR